MLLVIFAVVFGDAVALHVVWISDFWPRWTGCFHRGIQALDSDVLALGTCDNGQMRNYRDRTAGRLGWIEPACGGGSDAESRSAPAWRGIHAIRKASAERYPWQHRALNDYIVLTSDSEDERIFPAIKAGALSYLLKEIGHEELVRAI